MGAVKRLVAVAGLLLIYLSSTCFAGSGECPAGHYVANDQCPPCPDRTFNTRKGYATSCADCLSRCWSQANAHIVSVCNSTQDLRCECDEGFFAKTGSQCNPHSKCETGFQMTHSGTPTSNVLCERLPALSPTSTKMTPRGKQSKTTWSVYQPTTLLPNTKEMIDIPAINTSTATSEVEYSTPDYSMLLKILVGGVALLAFVIVVAVVINVIINCRKNRPRSPFLYGNDNISNPAGNGARKSIFTTNCDTTDASLCAHNDVCELRSESLKGFSLEEQLLELIHN